MTTCGTSRVLERLEVRRLLAVVDWDGGITGSGSDFLDAANWVGDVLPGPADTARIGAGAGPAIVIGREAAVGSLDVDRAVIIRNATLTVADRIRAGVALTVGAPSATGSIAFPQDARIEGTVNLRSSTWMSMGGNLLLDGTVSLNFGTLYFTGDHGMSTTTGGMIDSVVRGIVYFSGVSPRLTIGEGVTVRGSRATVQGYGAGATLVNLGVIQSLGQGLDINNAAVLNRGVIEARGSQLGFSIASITNLGTLGAAEGGSLACLTGTSIVGPVGTLRYDLGGSITLGSAGEYHLSQPLTLSAGQTLTLESGWKLDAGLTLSGGVVNLGGTFSPADVGNIRSTSGVGGVGVVGTYDLAGSTLHLGAPTGHWWLGGTERSGAVAHGSLTWDRGYELRIAASAAYLGRLIDMRVMGDLTLSGNLGIAGNLVVDGTLRVDASRVVLEGTQTLDGASGGGELRFVAGGSSAICDGRGQTLTVGPNLTVSGGGLVLRNFGLRNQGRIIADAPGSMLSIQVGSGPLCECPGQVGARDGGELELFAGEHELVLPDVVFEGQGTKLSISSDAHLRVDAPIRVEGTKSLTLGGRWELAQRLTVEGGTLTMSGIYTIDSVAGIVRENPAQGTIVADGWFDLLGRGFALDRVTGSWTIGRGFTLVSSVAGGEFAIRDGQKLLEPATGYSLGFEGVAFVGDLWLRGQGANVWSSGLLVLDGRITLSGALWSVFGNASVTTRTGGRIELQSSFAGAASTIVAGFSSSELVIGANVVVEGDGSLGSTPEADLHVISRGTVRVVGRGKTLTIGASVTNEGRVEAANGGTLRIRRSMGGAGGVNISGGTLELENGAALQAGSVVNAGSLSIGVDSAVTVSGEFRQAQVGRLNIEYGDAARYGRISAASAVLAGTATVRLVGAVPRVGASFRFLSAGVLTGAFGKASLFPTSATRGVSIRVGAGGLDFEFGPPPPMHALVAE